MTRDLEPNEVAALLLVGLLAIGGSGYWIYSQGQAVSDAEAVDAVVLESSVREVAEGYDVEVRYRYSYGGESYTSDAVWASSVTPDFGRNEGSEAEAFVERYPEDGTVTAYVDPGNPSESFLATRSSNSTLPYLFLGVGLLVFGSGVWNLRAHSELLPWSGGDG